MGYLDQSTADLWDWLGARTPAEVESSLLQQQHVILYDLSQKPVEAGDTVSLWVALDRPVESIGWDWVDIQSSLERLLSGDGIQIHDAQTRTNIIGGSDARGDQDPHPHKLFDAELELVLRGPQAPLNAVALPPGGSALNWAAKAVAVLRSLVGVGLGAVLVGALVSKDVATGVAKNVRKVGEGAGGAVSPVVASLLPLLLLALLGLYLIRGS